MILGFSGKLSGGKTCTAVMFAYDRWKAGKKVIANFFIQFPEGDHRTLYIRNDQLVDFLKANYQNNEKLKAMFQNSVLIIDEAVNLISARRSSTSLNELFLNFFMMAGKLDLDLVWTAQSAGSQTDKLLRDVTNIYGSCYRVTQDGKPLIMSDRIIKDKVMILVIFEFNLDVLGMKYKKIIYDPSPYWSMYDTREMNLLDRSNYMRGGSKDLRKL